MRRRSGFTLVEVLVAMALILFIMTILAAAFGAATQTVSDLKAAGDLAEKLRGAATIIKRDLEADHFSDSNGPGPRLSSATFWDRLGPAANQTPRGFLRIYQGQKDIVEGMDLDNIPSYYQTTTALDFTIHLPPRSRPIRGGYLSAVVPGGSPLLATNDPILGPPDQRYADTPSTANPSVYTSQTAEVVFFLVQNVDVTDNTNGQTPLPLYALYRRQFLTVPTVAPNHWTPPAPVPASPANVASYLETSFTAIGGNLVFNSAQDLTMPVHRFWMDFGNPAGSYRSGALTRYQTMGEANPNYQAADLLMTDVVSFDVRVLLANDPNNPNDTTGSEFRDLFDPLVQAYANGNPAFSTPNGPRVFDTWSNQTDATMGADYTAWQTPGTLRSVPLYKNAAGHAIAITAIQVTLRVWDFKTKKTRQVTIVQQT